MKIKDIMTTKILTLKTTSKIYEAQEIMKENDIGFIPILEDNKIVGIVTDKDLVKNQVKYIKTLEIYFNKQITEIMNTTFDYVCEDDEEEIVYQSMKEKQRRRFPVVDEKKNLVGVVSITDLNIERINNN